MQIILGVDPGGSGDNGTTGIAVIVVDGTSIHRDYTDAVPGGYTGFCEWLAATDLTGFGYVICEKFVPYNKGADISPVRIEGALGYVRPDTIFQPAGGKNKAIPDRILRAQGWYEDGSHHHDVREAIRHVLFWLKKQNYPAVLEMFR